MKSDRERLRVAFAALRRKRYIADGPLGDTPSDGWTTVYDRTGEDDAPAVFFTTETERAFKGDKLARKLSLQWRGDARTIVETLGKHGFTASMPDDGREAITVVAGPPTKLGRAAAPAKPSLLSRALGQLGAAVESLEGKGWKIVWNSREHYYEGRPPSRTVSIAAPSLTKLPAQLKKQAKGFANPRHRVFLYVPKQDRPRVIKILRAHHLAASSDTFGPVKITIDLPRSP